MTHAARAPAPLALAALALLSACGGGGGARNEAKLHPPGTVLSYVRSNQDGTLPSRVIVRVDSAEAVTIARKADACASVELTQLALGARTRPAAEIDPANDLAEFVLFGPAGRTDFAFTPKGGAPAKAVYEEAGKGVLGPVVFFRIEGYPETDASGGASMNAIAFDGDFGHVVEARLSTPSQPGMTDYKLRLEKVEEGEAAWAAAQAPAKDCAPS